MNSPDFILQKEGKVVFVDPRPDLAKTPTESILYGVLLMKAWAKNRELAMLLHGFRCQGTKLVVTPNAVKLQPVIDPRIGWPTQDDYDKEKGRLMPFLGIIKSIMPEVRGCLDGQISRAS